MAENKRPFFKPGIFSGSVSENIDLFLKKFERAAAINGWTDTEKVQYIAVYLEGTGIIFYDNVLDTNENIKWDDLVTKFRLEFEPIAQTDMLRLMLEKRKQLPDEQTIAYINETESLCRRIDKNMSQEEMARNIMKGLKPSIVRYIGIMENKSLDELKKNVRKYEMVEFMITGKVEQCTFEVEKSIINNTIQQINTDDKNNKDEVNKLREEIEKLKISNEQLKMSKVSNNPYFGNSRQSKPKHNNFGQNYFSTPWWQMQSPQANQNVTQWYKNPFPYNQPFFSTNSPSPTNNQYNNNGYNTQKRKCNFCSKTNHTEDKCYAKHKSQLISCQICNVFGHSASTCHLFLSQSKKLEKKLKNTDNCSPTVTARSHQTVNKIYCTPDSLYIIALFENSNTPVTIDTGANICCVREELLPRNQVIMPTLTQLFGPDNKPLYVLGITGFSLTIEKVEFKINAYVIRNLSSAIILGKDFLSNHNAIINFNDSYITLNNNINIKLNSVKTNNVNIITNISISENNIRETKGDIFDSPSDFAIAHCISADLKLSKGIARDLCNKYGNVKAELAKSELKIGNVIALRSAERTIFYMITKQNFFDKPTYKNVEIAIQNLRKESFKINNLKIAMPRIASGLDGRDWPVIKQYIYKHLQYSGLEIKIYHKSESEVKTHDWKSKEHIQVIESINTFFKNRSSEIKQTNHTPSRDACEVFKNFKPGENVPGDGNCGLYAICNALNDNKMNKITISDLLELLNLSELPNYWFSDGQLAAIANHYNFDTYVYNDANNTGIIYGKGDRLPVVLYNVEKNTHWIPGTRTHKSSHKIPNDITYIETIEPIDLVLKKVNNNSVDIICKKGKENRVADPLSRNSINNIQIVNNDKNNKAVPKNILMFKNSKKKKNYI